MRTNKKLKGVWSAIYSKKYLKLAFLIIFLLILSIPSIFAGIIQLPQTGQTICYNSVGAEISCAGTGQDADIQAGIAWPNPRFSVSGDCAVDNLTGLMWAKDANLPNGEKTWQLALEFANSLSLCGFNDWRLPNVNELESLVNAGEANFATWLNGQGFLNVQSNFYWSSTSSGRVSNGGAWIISMWGGTVSSHNKYDNDFVWPVRTVGINGSIELPQTGQVKCYNAGGNEINCAGTGQDGDIQAGIAWPNPRFSVSGDCVVDNLTGLMWAKDANLPNGGKTWQQALEFANSLSLCGFTDWHLPNRKELRSLINYSKYEPPLSTDHPFTDLNVGSFWSSTTGPLTNTSAWFISTGFGVVYDQSTSNISYVWPVRGGESGSLTTHVLTVASLTPNNNVNITVSPNDNNAQGNGTTQFIRTYNDGTSVTLTAPSTAGGNSFNNWGGCDTATGTTCTVTMNSDRTVTVMFNAGLSPVYRFWSNTYLHHFYTISETDKNYVIATWPETWTYEGPVFYAYPTQVEGTLPVYRFWSDTFLGHFYTISEEEKNYVMNTWLSTWTYEGPVYYAYPTQVEGTLPVYRFWSDIFLGHFYTISETEKDYVIATWPDTWTYEGPVFYAYPY